MAQTESPAPAPARARNRAGWPILVGLLVLSFVPVAGGGFRLATLLLDVPVTPANARFMASPLPVGLHVFSSSLFCVLGAFQFWPGFRRANMRWHRRAGRILVPAGLVSALSGLWMSQFYPLPPSDGFLLYLFRLGFGSGMVISILLAVAAILRRDIPRHQAWMMRGYAIGLGAGTQVVTYLPWFILFGEADEFQRALLMGASWVLNLAVAEWVIRRSARRGA